MWLSEWRFPYNTGSRQLIGSRHLIPPGLLRASLLPNASCPSCSLLKTQDRNWAALSYVAERLQCFLQLPEVNTPFPSRPDVAQTLAYIVPALSMRLDFIQSALCSAESSPLICNDSWRDRDRPGEPWGFVPSVGPEIGGPTFSSLFSRIFFAFCMEWSLDKTSSLGVSIPTPCYVSVCILDWSKESEMTCSLSPRAEVACKRVCFILSRGSR